MTREAAGVPGDPQGPGRGEDSEQSEDATARFTASSPVPTTVSFCCPAEQSETLSRSILQPSS